MTMKRRSFLKGMFGTALFIPASRLDFGVPRALPAIDTTTTVEQALADRALAAFVRNAGFLDPQAMRVSLHDGDPISGASEVDGGGYARQPVTLHASGQPFSFDTDRVEFAAMPMGAVSHVGIWSPDGRLIGSSPIANGRKMLLSGDSLITNVAMSLSVERG